MSKQDRLNWISRGSPFTLMRPAAKLRDRLRAHGYTVYDIGNREHLEHEPPEDHTPYSETGWPGKAKYGVGYAIDIMPPKSGARSKLTGQPLPSLQRLGAQMVADRNAGIPGIRWLKYMNWEPQRDNGGPCYQDSWKPNHARRSSSDRGHIHQSGATGFETSSIGDDYDPVARVSGEWDEMASKAEIKDALIEALRTPLPFGASGPARRLKDPNLYPPAGWSDQSVLSLLAYLFEASRSDDANEQQIVDGVLAGLGSRDLDDAATALRAAFGDRAAELGAKLTQSG
ncbi:hypothetical protein O7626_40105 [Micromonospora sp. WMMD1102]|uniref:hypothetical protein n=1 Tax=Micromonospora sp. WMMD1102 TaxID=3016105 RepID=UPI00241575E1|nr:hypothetical protein [Micromonospora sp. WMMD1102]MDG4792021.1 hypothetical protein [Micromonospora sp. WMMD1102]